MLMDHRSDPLEKSGSVPTLLGYLNFSAGKPDPRFQKEFNDLYADCAARGDAEPWMRVYDLLRQGLDSLKSSGGAFRDASQSQAVLDLAFQHLLPAYRRHHADLLFHQSDADLWQPFFLVRVFEAVLRQGPPWNETERIVGAALTELNDYVGWRPVAILETRPKGEPYAHERARPIPLYLHDAGVAWGRYHDLVEQAIEILRRANRDLLANVGFDLDQIEELALDPRAYDQGHPANRRPNNIFGEWDPHHLDNQGRYRRYVVRQVTLEALLDRVEHPGALDVSELRYEASAVLAGTLLMGTGLTGASPSALDSTATLGNLLPQVARYRDAFYTSLLRSLSGRHAARLQHEAVHARQPFGGVRQAINQYLARHRAVQLQQRQLVILYAEMGYAEASRQEAANIPVGSVRFLSEILGRLGTGHLLADQGRLAEALGLLGEVEDLLQRGIDCGALVDPWNILGFQGLYPLSAAREDSIHDPRVDELLHLMEQLFNLAFRLVSESSASGQSELSDTLLIRLRRLADWWDRFATVEVSDLDAVHGGDAVTSAEHVREALAHWHERGSKAGDLAFWRQHLEHFQTPKAFALVVDALLRKEDYRAAMALLMNWLGQSEHVPLEQGEFSFHSLALRWLLGFTGRGLEHEPALWPATCKFFDYLEANAEEWWNVPTLETLLPPPAEADDDNLYGAAYEDVTYRDSTDNRDNSLAEGEPTTQFELEAEADRIGKRLRFLSTVARLWQIAAYVAAQSGFGPIVEQEKDTTLGGWLATGRRNIGRIEALLDAVGAQPIPPPLGSYDSLVEFDQRRVVKEQLLYMTIGTCLDMQVAVGGLAGALGMEAQLTTVAGEEGPIWEQDAINIERGLLEGKPEVIRAFLPNFIESMSGEPLLFTALADGGQPRDVLRARLAQRVLQALVINFPRLGLLRETARLLHMARGMEQAHPPRGRGVSEFNHLFRLAHQAVVEAVVEATPPSTSAEELVDLLEGVTWPFLELWVEHSSTLQLSPLEAFPTDEDWRPVRDFIKRFGGELFQPRFLALGNIRGVLHGGVGSYLDYLRDNPDPLHPVALVDALENSVRREDAVRWLTCILQTLLENYEEYKDYNTTTPQSDYGENLYQLLEFLRLKAAYDRQAWQGQPVVLAHETLVRHGRHDAATRWQQSYAAITSEWADQQLKALAELQRTHGMVMRTVADRLNERFLTPLVVDRLRALVEPAMAEARQMGEQPAFTQLRSEIQAFTQAPTGVGLDVPSWLWQMQEEVHRVRARHTALATLAEDFFRVPRLRLTLDEIRAQVKIWDNAEEPPSS